MTRNSEDSFSTAVVGSRPTICHVLHTLDVGGAELLAKQFAFEFADRFRPVFLCLDAIGTLGEQFRERGVTVKVVGRNPGFDHQCARRIARFLREENVQLVHAHQYAPFFYSSLARIFNGNYPILFTEHGRDYPDYRRSKRVWANKLLLRRHDRVVAVGECVRSALIDYEGLSSSRVKVIYNGVDGNQFNPQRPSRKRVRKSLGLDDGEIAIVQVARLNRLKDYGTAILAMAQVCKAASNVKYFIVGEGEERSVIERSVQDLNLQERVRMLGLRNDVPNLLEGMDMFLLSSLTEGIPLTLIEAMFAQLPCIATRVGGIQECVVDGITGLVSAANQPDDLAEQLLSLVRSPATRLQMGERGRERAIGMFHSDRMFEEYECLYYELTSARLALKSDAGGPP